MIIYKATNTINNKIYVGQTTKTLEYRRNQHERSYKYKKCKNNIIARAIKKYGKDNFTWQIIDTANSIDDLNIKEEWWINKLNSLASNGCGYNDKKGGNNRTHSNRTKELIGRAQKGEKNHMYGKRGSDNATSKPVMEVYNKRIYESASECSELTGLQLSKICAVCRGVRGSTGGRVFRYIDTDGQIIEPNNPKQQVRKRVINTQTGEIFDNVDCATISMGRKCGSGLSKALKDGKGICYMFDVVWCYEGVDDLEILNYEITPKPPKPYEILSKQVKNIDTGEIFNSIAEGSRSINCSKSTLSKKLKEGNGECTLKNNKWILL